ncbi:putative quinol monooxygenase [Sanyastnella coralliicola]|uniref:putative quinol monooxygenase n=1 Tax=Sanyastnella coralliicola TaxID=3069118 RepID=UPI0027B8DF2C|nr:antibiotic biosynthesis monooxygenase family protein [Longitalea sp. SCSIO 12813]
MIVRIVKMVFRPEGVEEFLTTFEKFKSDIRNQPGCLHLELLQQKDGNTFFTYSYWESEKELNAYRDSETFKTVWPLTKKHFDAKPEAWTTEQMVVPGKNEVN